MWSRIKDAVLWVQALDRYGRQDFAGAISKLAAIDGPRSTASEYFALLGSANIALASTEEGAVLLAKAVYGSVPARPEYTCYVRAYCAYYLAILNGDEGTAVTSHEKALRMDAPAIIRRWLPLS